MQTDFTALKKFFVGTDDGVWSVKEITGFSSHMTVAFFTELTQHKTVTRKGERSLCVMVVGRQNYIIKTNMALHL